MEGRISENWRILAATVFSVVFIVGAYLFARGIESPQVAQASDETALLKAIATKDSDTDGLPDWEESLYGTDPHDSDTFHLGMTDGEAVSRGLIVPKAIAETSAATSSGQIVDPSLPAASAEGTLTAAFAKSFFTLYVTAKQNNGGADLSEADISNISNQALTTLAASIAAAPDYKKTKDLTIIESSPDAFKTFAAQAEAVLFKNTNDATTTELHYLGNAIMNGDTTAYGHINSIAKSYQDSAAGIAVLPVPKELVADDLLLVNTLMRMGGIAKDFALFDTDPLATMLAIQQYATTTASLDKAITDIGNVYAAMNISLPPNTPGASLVNMVADIEKAKAAAKKP